MHGAIQSNQALLTRIKAEVQGLGCEVIVCAPYPYLAQLKQALSGVDGVAWGAQSVSEFASGAFTGEVSASMLLDFDCRYVLVGHSERRSHFGETDSQVAAKFEAAQRCGLIPVLCVGEDLGARQSGATNEVVSAQLGVVLDRVGVSAFASAVVAYEPVWAIGTGVTATPKQAQDTHSSIRAQVASLNSGVADGLRILYGGSVKSQNALELFVQPDIDGGLVGGAALDADDFLAICRAAG